MPKPRIPDSDSSDSDGNTPALIASSSKVTFSTPPTNINNDHLEKTQRRKRMSMATPLHLHPPSPTDSQSTTSIATASKRRQSGRRLSAIVTGVESGGPGSDLARTAPVESMEEMSLKFEEWMKMATDNKITVNNTWNFALIDYFADLTLLRNGPDDQSINFQKASSTLDGCVKIWTSRVDSAFTETGKLLSGLSETGGGEDGEEGGEGGSDGEDGDEGVVKKKRKTPSKHSTLAPSFQTLSNKKLDLEFFVDPLFKKTSADFDEGGAAGLLMNHLGSAGGMRLVFDAGDVILDEEGDGDIQEEDEEELKRMSGGGKVDIQALKIKFPEFSETPSPLAPLQITSALNGFVFSSSSNMLSFDLTILNAAVLSAASSSQPHYPSSHVDHQLDDLDVQPATGGAPQQDFFDFDDDYAGGAPEDFGGGQGDEYGGEEGLVDEDGNPIPSSSRAATSGGGGEGGSFGFEPFDPRRQPNEKDLVMAMVGGSGLMDGEGEEMFDYFDRQLLARNWAGPEHWKTRRTVNFGKKADSTSQSTSTPAKTTRKPPPTIDFLSSEPSIPSSKLFELPTSKTSTLLPASSSRRSTASSTASKKLTPAAAKKKAKEEKEREKELGKLLLPDDLHFSSTQLLRLFTKKLFTLRMRKQGYGNGGEAPPMFRGDGEVDEHFWAQAAADQADIQNENQEDDGFGSQADPAPFATQFFNDDDYEGPVGFDTQDQDSDAEIGASSSMLPAEEETLWAGTQGLKRTRPDYVKYTKRAKRVDVKKLKDSIWKGLDIFAPPIEGEEADEEPAQPPPPEEDPTQPRVFSTVVSSLQSSYPTAKFNDISTSYCFICLLHLCNERGLQLEAARGDNDLPVGLRIVGEDDDEEMDGDEERGSREIVDETIVGQLGFLKISKDRTAKGHA